MKHNHALRQSTEYQKILALKKDRHGNINQATWKLQNFFKPLFWVELERGFQG